MSKAVTVKYAQKRNKLAQHNIMLRDNHVEGVPRSQDSQACIGVISDRLLEDGLLKQDLIN